MEQNQDTVLSALIEFHQAVETKVLPLLQRHGERLVCHKGCSGCCRDDLTVFAVEALRIQTFCGPLLEQEPHPPGSCAFLDDAGACRVYEHRPYVCRTQGLPLRWIEELDGEWVEYRDICPLEEDGEPLEELEEQDCWTLGEPEEQLAALQARLGGGGPTRIPLRSLFSRSAPGFPV